MRISGVDFPEPLLNALRGGRLVIFAGAGVSMGPPANLPNFRRLADQVAMGTGQSIGSDETEDRFLGRLEDRGTDVHQRAADILQRGSSEPTQLHLNLVRFYGAPEDARIVTTNFEDLFAQAAIVHFASLPAVYQAPTLPPGNRFRGLVHLHGSVNEPAEMVLTDRDFGRAYLTESDGWARRFLIDLFSNYTVLFVGYSHSDTIMTYLTPSLPTDDGQRRFALIGDRSDDPDHWHRMGIQPVTFHQDDENDYSGLGTAVAGLANFLRRGVLDWQQEISTIAGGYPPIDDDSAGTIEHALTDPVMTRFFVEAAELPEWIAWLDRRGYLDHLFTDGELEVQETTLAYWLVSRFAINRSDELFGLIARHRGRLNPHMWNRLAWSLRRNDEAPLHPTVLSRWVHFLMTCVPPDFDDFALSGLAQTCADLEMFQNLLQVYDVMTASRHQVRPGYELYDGRNREIRMRSFWEECLEPHLPNIAHSLLERTTMRLEERRSAIVAWDLGSETWDTDSHGRSAIEPHSQDDLPREVDALIDAARDCLAWLAANDSGYAGTWCDRYAGSAAPLLRRLAIHAMTERNDLTADERIAWILESCDVNEVAAHHEIVRAAAYWYPQASPERRRALVEAVSRYHAPESEHFDSDELSAHHCFTWFHWLHEADPDCGIAKEALEAVWAHHPQFVPSEHPDFTHFWRVGEVTGPLTANSLLAKPADEVLPDLLAYEPTDQESFDGHDRWALLRALEEAVQTNPSWGLDLADAMVSNAAWDTDIWYHIILSWATSELDQDSVMRVMSHLSAGELHQRHARQIPDVLSHLVRNADQVQAVGLLDAANSIAVALRPYAAVDELPQMSSSVGGVPQYVSWLERAVNHASGKLALFWTFSSELWRKQQEPAPQSLNVEYREALDAVVMEDGVPGKFGRAVLAGNLQYFLAVDEDWTISNLLPLFDTDHDDFQCVWDGFLTWGRLYPAIAERLREKSIAAIPRVTKEFSEQMRTRFVEFYVVALGWLISSANDDWITKFFKHADAEMKRQFAFQIGHRLRNLDEPGQQEWWRVWLNDYWSNRLQGVPCPLDDAEIAEMLAWVMHLPAVFPEAVGVAMQMRQVPLNHSHILHGLSESELIERYPDDLAKLLVNLGKHDTNSWFWFGTREAIDKLLAKGTPQDISEGLRELIVRYNLH